MRLRPPPFIALPLRHHFFGSLTIALVALIVMSVRIADRRNFASSELYQEVAQRWGTPIDQPMPSVRYVESGSVFNHLDALPLAAQRVRVDASMNYRKRGLVYFSGFDFQFDGRYRLVNDRGKTIDVVFVFPLQMIRDQVLLSDLRFEVDGQKTSVELSDGRDRLQWTGRLEEGDEVAIDIAFTGRGLDSFTYRLDPALPVRDFSFELAITGGRDFDYAAGVLPAAETRQEGERTILAWSYDALESGVPVGAILPSEEAWDAVLLQMLLHAVPAFLLFFAARVAIFERFAIRPRYYQSYLVSAGWTFFYVLLPYLAAFLHFYLAWVLSLAVVTVLVTRFVGRLASAEQAAQARRFALVAIASSLAIPTLAVILQGYTGLIYTFELLAILAILMRHAANPKLVQSLDQLFTANLEEPDHA